MRPPEMDRENMAKRREKMLSAAYRLFTERGFTAVRFEDIAKEADVGRRTVIRYFNSKPELIIEVAVWKWKQFIENNRKRRQKPDFEGETAVKVFEFYLDSFLELYKNNKDLLRFNQMFNVYILLEGIEVETMQPYGKMIDGLKKDFHLIYEKGLQDHTIHTEIPEEKMFLATLHLMLAAVTRYAVGLVYQPENVFDDLEELEILKEALLQKYGTSGDA